MKRHQEGYRFIRQYHGRKTHVPSWALWERVDGELRRKGTAKTERDAYAWIGCADLLDRSEGRQ